MNGPSTTLKALGYDEYGNCSALLTPYDKARIKKGDVHRVSGDAICAACNNPFKVHPRVQGALWITRGCNMLVKL